MGEMMQTSEERAVLQEFLSFRPESANRVLEKFAALEGAVYRSDGDKLRFVYVPGRRKDRVVLAAHADTVWDRYYLEGIEKLRLPLMRHEPVWENGVIRQGGSGDWGLGADDRAGCAMLWLLRESGHSLLVTDGEERGQTGAWYLMEEHPDIAAELNRHQYMVQLDRRGSRDYKTYRLPVTDAFRRYIEEQTGYQDAGMKSRTDIVVLCKSICGVNLSIGYHDEHRPEETLVYEEWLHTLETVRRMLAHEQPAFPLEGM